MTNQKNNSDLELNTFFESAKRSMPTPSETLKDKILQDAEQNTQPWERQTPVTSQKLWWYILFEDIGGFQSVAGYGTVAIFSFLIGFSAPSWSDFPAQLLQYTIMTEIDLVDPFAGLELSYLEILT